MQAVPLSPKHMPAAFDRKEFRLACVNLGALMADLELELQFNLIKNQPMHDAKVRYITHILCQTLRNTVRLIISFISSGNL